MESVRRHVTQALPPKVCFRLCICQETVQQSKHAVSSIRHTKDMPLLRLDHSPFQTILPGVWQVLPRCSTRTQKCQAGIRGFRLARWHTRRSPFHLRSYFCWKKDRMPRPVAVFSVRRASSPKFSGQATFAAACCRARCVLAEGCPVVKVHCSLAFALHIGQRTDKICRNVNIPFLLTSKVFNIGFF
jgi:hypothetical protein